MIVWWCAITLPLPVLAVCVYVCVCVCVLCFLSYEVQKNKCVERKQAERASVGLQGLGHTLTLDC